MNQNPNTDLEFGVAFQGGGAKLITLLSAVEGLQKAQQNVGNVRISSVSGSSAGAIAAVLYAMDCDIDKIRTHVNSVSGKACFRRLRERQSLFTICSKLFRGKPIYAEDDLKHILLEIFGCCGFNNLLEKPTMICDANVVITDIKGPRSEIISVNGSTLTSIIETLIDSCAIPFAFRTYRNKFKAHLVDGGLFENFPINYLLEKYRLSRVIGITFDKDLEAVIDDTTTEGQDNLDQSDQNNYDFDFFSYLGKIAETAIDANVYASFNALHSDNIITLPNKYSALEFGLAIDSLKDSQDSHRFIATNVKNSTSEIFKREIYVRNKIRAGKASPIPINYDGLRDTCANLMGFRRTENLRKRSLQYIELRSQIEAQERPASPKDDYYVHQLWYEIPVEGIECIEIVISEFKDEKQFSIHADFSVVDDAGNPIDYIVLPLSRKNQNIGNYRALGVFFNSRIYQSMTNEICITQKEVVGEIARGIEDKGWDYLEISNAYNDGEMTEVEIYFGIPKNSLEKISIRCTTDHHEESTESFKYVEGEEIDGYRAVANICGPFYDVVGFRSIKGICKDEAFNILIEKS